MMQNKYRKALDNLELSLKRYTLYELSEQDYENLAIIQELVDKETSTSMKPVYKFIKEPYEHRWYCPKCNEIIRTITYQDVEEDTGKLNYCPECGTHIDWSDE